MADKIYCGNGRVIKTQYGELMKLSFTEEDLQAMQDNLENGWINVVVKERREPSEKGTTHYLEVDTWKPNQEGAGSSAPTKKAPTKPAQTDEVSAEDLPF
jgi:hypothetical protein